MNNTGFKDQLRSLRTQPLTLFWRLFLSMLTILLLTSALSVGIERWINANELNSRMQQHVERLLIDRLHISEALRKGDIDSIRNMYRENKRLGAQIRIIDEQGQLLFPKFGGPRTYNNSPPEPLPHRQEENPLSQQQISADVTDYPELEDLNVVGQDGHNYTIQLQPRLPLRELLLLRQNHTIIRIGLIVLFSILVCYWLSRTLTRRIRRVQRAVHLISEGQFQTGTLLADLGNDELGKLAKDVSKLSNRLADSELARKQMLSDISHELRSPLARLEVATELTRDFAPEANNYLDRIEKESVRMNELIEQIIRIQSLQMQQYKANTEQYQPLDVYQLIDDIREDVCFEFQDKQIDWQWRVESQQTLTEKSLKPSSESNSWLVWGDYEQLHSAFENILRNAFTHTGETSTVTIALSTTVIEPKQKPAIKLQVMDSGDGINGNNLERIFQPFVRLSASRERVNQPSHSTEKHKTSGYGLGLAIAHAVIVAHQGQIQAYNRTDGSTGLIIEVLLPAYGDHELG